MLTDRAKAQAKEEPNQVGAIRRYFRIDDNGFAPQQRRQIPPEICLVQIDHAIKGFDTEIFGLPQALGTEARGC